VLGGVLAIAVARGDLTTRVVSKVIGAGVLMSPSPPEMSADSMLLKRMQRNVSGKRRGGLRTGLSTAPAKKLQRHDSAELSRQRPGRTICCTKTRACAIEFRAARWLRLAAVRSREGRGFWQPISAPSVVILVQHLAKQTSFLSLPIP
jgi:hypothetical protein